MSVYPTNRVVTLSANLNVSVPAQGYYTGSGVSAGNYAKKCVIGVFSGSASALGVTNFVYASFSPDNVAWNNFQYRSGSIVSGSTPAIVVIDETPMPLCRGILANTSGSALSGSLWILGLIEG